MGHSSCVCVFIFVFIKVHITAQPDPVIEAIQYHSTTYYTKKTSSQTRKKEYALYTVLTCACVVCVSSHLFWIVDVPVGVTQDFTTFLLRCSPSFFSREGFCHFFPSSTGKSNFVFKRINRSPLIGHFFYLLCFYLFARKKSQFIYLDRDSKSRPNVRRFRGYQLNHRCMYVCMYVWSSHITEYGSTG